jgi:hypothetical protein
MKGKLTMTTLKPTSKPRLSKTNVARLRKMTEQELEHNASNDDDNLPLSKKHLVQFKSVSPAK